MLEVRYLQCNPVGEAPVHDISFRVSEGEFVALCGPNGAGKSTLCRCLAGLFPRDSGEILLDGIPLPIAPWEVANAGLVVLMKGRRIFPELSVEENLLVPPRFWRNGNRSQKRLQQVFDLFPELADRRCQPGGTLSGGEQQMVAIGRALMAAPRILVLDEPSLGLAPCVIADLHCALVSIRASGVGILVTEEDPAPLKKIADFTRFMIQGRMVVDERSAFRNQVECRLTVDKDSHQIEKRVG